MTNRQGGSGPDWRAVGLFATVTALTAWPLLAAVLERGTLGAFQHFSHDAFYYLAIADHSREAPFFSFDGRHPTNGFHPLWLFYLYSAFSIFDLEMPAQIRFAALSGIFFTALGTGGLAVAAMRLSGRVWLALLTAIPGFFHLALPHFGQRFGSQWAFANGMESPLSVLFFGALAAWLFRAGRETPAPTASGWLVLSVALTASTLARLDDVFLLIPFALIAWSTADGPAARRASLLRLGLIPAITIAAYMLYNFGYAGSPLPSSGATKAQPLWALFRNGYATLTTFLPFLDFLREGPSVWHSEAWRILQMLVPAAIAGAWLWRWGAPVGARGARLAPWRASLGALALYVIFKSIYNFTMVGLWHQGDWYYVVSIMVTNLLICVVLADALPRTPARPTSAAPSARALARALPACASLALIVLIANAIQDRTARGGYMRRNHTFWSEREATAERLERHCSGCGVLAFEDGIISYSLGSVPTLSGFGLASDREAERARAEGRLLDLAYARGHALIATVNYPMSEEAYLDPERFRLELGRSPHLHDARLERWSFALAFRSPQSGVAFVRFRPTAPRD